MYIIYKKRSSLVIILSTVFFARHHECLPEVTGYTGVPHLYFLPLWTLG